MIVKEPAEVHGNPLAGVAHPANHCHIDHESRVIVENVEPRAESHLDLQAALAHPAYEQEVGQAAWVIVEQLAEPYYHLQSAVYHHVPYQEGQVD